MDASAHHDANTLNDMVAAHVDRVFVARKHSSRDDWAVHFLNGNHIGIQLHRVLLQKVNVRWLFGMGVGRQFTVTCLPIGQPFQVPGTKLQFRCGRETRQKQSQRQQEHDAQHGGGNALQSAYTRR